MPVALMESSCFNQRAMNAYIATLFVLHPTEQSKPFVLSFFVVAENEEEAKKRGRERLSEAEFRSNTRDWVIEDESVGIVDEEYIEEAAIVVLGWQPPT